MRVFTEMDADAVADSGEHDDAGPSEPMLLKRAIDDGCE